MDCEEASKDLSLHRIRREGFDEEGKRDELKEEEAEDHMSPWKCSDIATPLFRHSSISMEPLWFPHNHKSKSLQLQALQNSRNVLI